MQTTHNGALLARYHYTLDATGNRTHVTETGSGVTREITNTYDALNRQIVSAYSSGEAFTYRCDTVGKRVAMTSTTPLSGTVVTDYTFDAANRLTTRAVSDGRAYTYTWSARGQMLAEYTQGYPVRTFTYDGARQLVAFWENDLMCYEFALQWGQERGNVKKLQKLTQQGPPPYYGKGVAWKESAFLMDTITYMNANPAIADNGANTFRDLAAPEYGLYDKVSWFRGLLDTMGVVYPQLWEVDFRQQAPKLDVPVYFFIGRHDINAHTVLTEQYYELLDAPHKQIVWFEHSGHTPWASESDRFVQAMVDTVLVQTQP